MTDVFPPDDELISSYLDGEATPDEMARVYASAAMQSRAEDLRGAIRLTADPVAPVDVGVVDDMIAAAMDAGGLPGNVTDLASVRRRSLSRGLMAAAAAVVLVALAVPTIRLVSDSSGGSDSAATSFANVESGTAAADEAASGSRLSPKGLAGPNETSGDTAASTTTAAAATTAAPAMESAPSDAVESSEMATGSTADFAAGLEIPGFPLAFDPTFDPLPELLQPVADLTSLRQVLIEALAGDDGAVGRAATTTTFVFTELDVASCAASLAAYLGTSPIGTEIADSAAVADFARVSIGGTLNWLTLVRLSPTRAVALLVDATTCNPVTMVDLAS